MSEEGHEQKTGDAGQVAGGGAEAEAPGVFISYSHDSDEHSEWVLKLAERLRGCGIEVVLDQWDVGPGDDLAKFMEKGVGEADRVLMICTEQYVRKADEGKGGVGYEAMIVTGELVKDLGTNKFIPVVRQGVGVVVVPRSVGTRLYVNLSAGQDHDNAFETLVREIHETPRAQKPALGKNPYGAAIYSPLMAVALAGVESGNSKFNNQQAMLDEFLKPKDWNAAGLTVVGTLPEALVFTYQALHGATCMEVGELGLAIALSRAPVVRAHHYEGVVLHRDHQFVGIPESFHHSFRGAWTYLTSMAEKWPWMHRIFGAAGDYQACLVAYYMALSVQELACRIADGQAESLDGDNLILDIPVGWLGMDSETQHAAYRRLVQSQDVVREIWRSLGISDKAMAASWPAWVAQAVRWMTRDNPWGLRGKPAHAALFEDVRPKDE